MESPSAKKPTMPKMAGRHSQTARKKDDGSSGSTAPISTSKALRDAMKAGMIIKKDNSAARRHKNELWVSQAFKEKLLSKRKFSIIYLLEL